MPLFIYFFLYSFHIGILCTYFLRSCYIIKSKFLSIISLNLIIFSSLVGTFILFNADCVNSNTVTGIFITLH
ncbi:hypothetical protein [Orientia tsutsugamushi]|uniref:hypothetical protein n=1 Tax=Orientia tsutsugamushi TaxID=784 RepID=UPI0013A54346|nr:hypothetical protein [Orientia tsutsugamushi]